MSVAPRSQRPSESPNSSPISEQLNQASGSFELVLSVVILGGIGVYLDRRFSTTPWLTIVLSVLGACGAVASVYYRYRHRIRLLRAETEALRAAARNAARDQVSR